MKKMLFKSINVIVFFLITFFSITLNSYAASFAYKDFNWDEFLKQNKNFWVTNCPKDDENCIDEILVTKKRFYVRLYELLADVPASYGHINDNYIIATVFYGLDPDTFRDPEDGEKDPYNLDDSEDSTTKDKFLMEADETAQDYFEKETDTLKTLVNSFVGYNTNCLAVTNEMPQTYKDPNDSNNTITDCPTKEYDYIDGKCIANVINFKGNFFDSIGLTVFGNHNKEKCEEKIAEKGFTFYAMPTDSEKKVSNEFFFNFLENSKYFDNKPHLQGHFEMVLIPSGYKSMKEFHEKATEEEKEKYKEDIFDCRRRIIKNIKDIIEAYGEENFSKVSETFNTVTTNLYWWPIGSDSTNEESGSIFASDEPSSTNIINNFGLIAKDNNRNVKNTGIDIGGSLGVTNVIASKEGVITSVTRNCPDDSDKECGGGYGNHIIVQHLDGNYTLYGNMYNGSITNEVGDSIKQGQIIGKVGSSGDTDEPKLHFEIRIGDATPNSAQDPLNYISKENTRPSATSSQLLEFIGNMEGTGPVEGNFYKVYNDSGGVATVGHGITLKYNADALKARGYDPSTLTVGSLIPKNIVDAIYQEDIDGRVNSIKAALSSNGLSLSEHQVAALASLQYNCGNINGFYENYEKYGSSEALCTNWWHNKALHDQKGNRLSGLEKRRKAECDLFVNANYNMNIYG